MPKGKKQADTQNHNPQPKGLPSREAITEMAETWLEVQSLNWKEKAGVPKVPRKSAAVVRQMVESFTTRFGKAHHQTVQENDVPVGVAYLRYSDANSNPRSLAQQLRNVLQKAAQEGVFIPWELVFADAALTGTTADRPAYQAAKEVVTAKGNSLFGLFVDDLGRAARNMIESLELAQSIDQAGGCFLAVSDGFDSRTPQSKFNLAMFAALHEVFIDQLRSKVNRGMDDAFLAGRVIQKPAFGYRQVPVLDSQARPQINSKGKVVSTREIDETEAVIVREIFTLYAVNKWSTDQIGRHLNERGVGNLTWDGSKVRQFLRRETYSGVEYYRKTRREKDPKTGRGTTRKRPRSEWKTRQVPELRIVSDELWQAAQQRLEQTGKAYRDAREKTQADPSRADAYPKTLFQLTCGSCGKPLMLGRSGKYASLCCLNGRDKKHGCTFGGYKSVQIVETALLNYLREAILTPEALKRLLEDVNRYLAAMPAPDAGETEAVQAELKAAKGKLSHLQQRMEAEEDLNGMDSLIDLARKIERKISGLQQRLRELAAQASIRPFSLQDADLERMLTDLRGLLSMEVPQAAPILREIFGPIVVEQIQEEGKKKPTWIGRFTLQGQGFVSFFSRSGDCPTTGSSEFPTPSGWTIGESCKVRLDEPPQYERLAQQALEYKRQGRSIQSIARELKVLWTVARDAIRFAETGGRPAPVPCRKRRQVHQPDRLSARA